MLCKVAMRTDATWGSGRRRMLMLNKRLPIDYGRTVNQRFCAAGPVQRYRRENTPAGDAKG
ncbi:hypothetical protein GCM10010399_68580 [Dactylosporangium fulvum]